MRLKPIVLRANICQAMAALSLLTGLPIQAATSGTIHVFGTLQESPCWLKMGQTEDEGATARSGNHALTLQLQDCPYSTSDETFWQQHKPSVRLAFFAPAYAGSSDLIRVDGSDHIALRLLDEKDQPLPAQFTGMRIPLSAESTILRWHAIQHPLSATGEKGDWNSSGRLRVSYD